VRHAVEEIKSLKSFPEESHALLIVKTSNSTENKNNNITIIKPECL